jgi:hypothetical protein
VTYSLIVEKEWLIQGMSPKRVAFFVWTAALGKILTHDNLRRCGIVVIEWCVMCKKHGESVDRRLLHCDVARVVWSYFYSLFGVEWVMPSSVLDLLSGWGTLLSVFGSRFLYVFCGACGVREILGFLRMWRLRLGIFVEMCLICCICGCRRIAQIVCRLLIFYFHVRLF